MWTLHQCVRHTQTGSRHRDTRYCDGVGERRGGRGLMGRQVALSITVSLCLR